MTNFFRIQNKGYSFDEMMNYNSDISAELDETEYTGICCADSVSSLRSYIKGWANDNHEIVIFKGQQTGELYDGVIARPLSEIARTSVNDFMSNDKWCDYEEW